MSNTKISSKGGSDQLGIYRPNTSAATSLDVCRAGSQQSATPSRNFTLCRPNEYSNEDAQSVAVGGGGGRGRNQRILFSLDSDHRQRSTIGDYVPFFILKTGGHS